MTLGFLLRFYLPWQGFMFFAHVDTRQSAADPGLSKFHNHEVPTTISSVLQPKNVNVVFNPTSEDKQLYETIQKVAAKSDCIALHWMCNVTNQKLKPIGVGLFTTKQIVAKLGGVNL